LTVESLSKSTDELLAQFSRRVDGMKNRAEYSTLIRRLDLDSATSRAFEYFGEGEFRAVGVDGSMDQSETLEMLLFYVNAMAYSAPFTVSKEGIIFDSKKMKKEDELGASSAVPLWLEDLGSVSEGKKEALTEDEYSTYLTDVSFSLMLMAELTSAVRALEDSTRILFMDRPLSGTFQSLGRDLREVLRSGKSTLSSLHNGDLMRDLYLFSAVPFNESPPAGHGYFIQYAVLQKMIKGRSFSQACDDIRLSPDTASAVKRRLIQRDQKFRMFVEGQADLELRKECLGYEERLENLAESVTSRIFSSEVYPLKVNDSWLTTRDLNCINFVKLVSLIKRCQDLGCLLLGITKDTGSTDVSRSVLKLVGVPDNLRPGLRHDRVMFTILSATNESNFRPPWRSVGYDACFATVSGNEEIISGIRPELRAARKFASREKLFVKLFFQTRASDRTIFRSPVFLYDRPYSPRYDSKFCTPREYVEAGAIATMDPYLESSGRNDLDDMILYILSLSDNPEVFEAFGHNCLLYMADKAVKTDVKLKRGLLTGIINLKLTPMARREKLFSVIRRYRDTRSEVETMRAEAES
jgi:hypothetical protein